MSSHYNLKAIIGGSEVVSESLELTGNSSFKVFPVSKNEGQTPIRGSAVVSILGKNHSIQLNHKVKDYQDQEPSSTKWSYIEDMYITGSTPVGSSMVKSQDTAYVRASRGSTRYSSSSSTYSTIMISRPYISYQNLMDTVGDFSGTHYSNTYFKGYNMLLMKFVMFYKYSSESGGTIIPPIDDDTPASNKARIPCRPEASGAPDWIKRSKITYSVSYDIASGGGGIEDFDDWENFIDFWDSIQTNPEYTNASFYYNYIGIVDFNESLNQRGSNTITISEIDNGKGVGIHGAKPLYLIISQQEGKSTYGVSMMPASSNMLNSVGIWSFDDMNSYQISIRKLASDNMGTFVFKPSFKIKSSTSYRAKNLASVSGGSVIVNPNSGNNTFEYQYMGLPIILRLYKETANGITKVSMRPYYKIKPGGSVGGTEVWKDSYNLMGSQNFNPLQYDSYSGQFHYLHIRDTGFRGFIAGVTQGDYGLCAIQLIPLCIYKASGSSYTLQDLIEGEGGASTKGVNYVNRYNRYESAVGGANSSTDVQKAAFLKWPNENGNNNPDYIVPYPAGAEESLPSKMGKNWENWIKDSEEYKYLDRVMLLPVLWTSNRLEENANFRSFLSTKEFGYYLLSPGISDTEIDQDPTTVYRIGINGIDIQIS